MGKVDDLARMLAKLQQEQTTSSRGPQLAYSSIEDGAIVENDAFGNSVAVFGKQYDGTHTAVSLAGPPPPVPSAPQLSAGPGLLTVRWNGKFVDNGLSPQDFKHVAVCVTGQNIFAPDILDQKATIRGEMGDEVSIQMDPGTYWVALFSWTLSGKSSLSSEVVSIDVLAPADLSVFQGKLDELDAAATKAQEDAAAANTAAGQAASDAAAAQSAAEGAVTAANDAASKAEAAESAANTATGAASAAESAADAAATKAQQALSDAQAAGTTASSAASAATAAQSAADDAASAASAAGTAAANADAKAAQAAADATKAIADALAAQQRADAAFLKAQSAMTAAGEAQTSANGKNNVYYRSALPSGSGFTTGDTVFIRSAVGQPVTAQHQWDGDSWEPTEFGHQIIASVDLGKATVGELDGVYIKSQSMKTDRLLIGDFDNRIPNGMGEFGEPGGWSEELLIDGVDKPTGVINAFKNAKGSGTIRGGYYWVDVEPQAEYLMEFWIKADLPNSRFYMELRNQDGDQAGSTSRIPGKIGASAGVYIAANMTVPTVWTKCYTSVTMDPATYRVVVGGMYFNHANGTELNAQVWLGGLTLKPRTPGVIISEGALDAFVITGPTIQTTSQTNRGVKWTDSGVKAYNSVGTQTFDLDASTGEASFLGRIRSGSTIEGANISGGEYKTTPVALTTPGLEGWVRDMTWNSDGLRMTEYEPGVPAGSSVFELSIQDAQLYIENIKTSTIRGHGIAFSWPLSSYVGQPEQDDSLVLFPSGDITARSANGVLGPMTLNGSSFNLSSDGQAILRANGADDTSLAPLRLWGEGVSIWDSGPDVLSFSGGSIDSTAALEIQAASTVRLGSYGGKVYADGRRVNGLTELGNEELLDMYTETGLYNQSANAQAATGFNYPEPSAGMLEVFGSDSGSFVYQRYTVYQARRRVYHRECYNGTWSTWVTLASAQVASGGFSYGRILKDGGSYERTVTLPAGTFTSPPSVVGSTESPRTTPGVNNITTTSFNMRLWNFTQSDAPSNDCTWIAVNALI